MNNHKIHYCFTNTYHFPYHFQVKFEDATDSEQYFSDHFSSTEYNQVNVGYVNFPQRVMKKVGVD